MPWSVRLQDESGKAVCLQDAVVEFGLIEAGATSRVLQYLDRYSDAYFNRMQMDDFLADGDRLAVNDADREQWMSVRKMALRCQSEPHLYLRFIGD
jgi:hypothetical protein